MVVPRKRKHSHNDLHAPLSSTDTGCKGEKQPQVEERRRSVRLRGRGTTIGPTDDTRNELLEGVAPGSDCSGGKVPQFKKCGRYTHARKTGQSGKHSHSARARRKVIPPTSSKEIEAKTSERGSPGCSELIQEFFNLTLHRRADDEDCDEQGPTRRPAPYDKHMKEDLMLKKVVYCPDLVSQLGDIAERAIRNYEATPGTTPVESMFDLERIRMELQSRLLHHGMTEGDVVEAYASIIARYIMPIVSPVTLLEKPKPLLPDMISWKCHIKHDRAIADAVIRVEPSVGIHDCPCQNSKSFKRKRERTFVCTVCDDNPSATMRQSIFEYFPSVLLFEFKNPRAGSRRHMDAMLEITEYDVFPWERCNDDEKCFVECGRKRIKGLGTRSPVTGDRMGFDAKNPVIRATTSWKHGNGCPTVNQGKGGETSDEKSGRWILQQGWAECVKNDSTFIVFNSGVREIIGYRCRESQTLYITDIINVHKQGSPGYFQLHIGLYIASIVDAMDRAEQLRHSTPASWLTRFDKGVLQEVSVTSRPNFEEALSNYPKLFLQPSQAKHQAITYYVQDKSYKRASSGDKWLLIKTDITHDSGIYHGKLILSETIYEKKIIVKIALDKYSCEKLSNEYDIYTELRDMPGIPLVYGYFVENSEPLRPAAALLMQYAGEPVDQSAIPSEQEQNIVDILTHIHSSGYVHRHLTERSILMLKEGNKHLPYIIGLGHAQEMQTPDEAEGEMLHLKDILRRIVKRRRTGKEPELDAGELQEGLE